MKAILLAGGRGTRISNIIGDVPKCTLDVGGASIIRHCVNKLKDKNISIVVCTGFKNELIKDSLKGLDVKYYNNPFYSITNSIASLWFAKEELNDDVIILNADVYYDSEIIDKLIDNDENVNIAVDYGRIQNGDYFFKLDRYGSIVKYGKDLPIYDRTCEYVGIMYIKKEFLPIFISKMDKLIDEGCFHLWWENVIYSLSDEGLKVSTVDCGNFFWSEVDFYDDYLRILNHVK